MRCREGDCVSMTDPEHGDRCLYHGLRAKSEIAPPPEDRQEPASTSVSDADLPVLRFLYERRRQADQGVEPPPTAP